MQARKSIQSRTNTHEKQREERQMCCYVRLCVLVCELVSVALNLRM